MGSVTCLKTFRNKKLTADQLLGRTKFFRWWRSEGHKRGVCMSAYLSRVPINGVMYKVVAGIRRSGDQMLVVENFKGERRTITKHQLHKKHLAKF